MNAGLNSKISFETEIIPVESFENILGISWIFSAAAPTAASTQHHNSTKFIEAIEACFLNPWPLKVLTEFRGNVMLENDMWF